MKYHLYRKMIAGGLLLAFVFAPGCTTVKKTFVSQKVVNLEPFVEQLVTLIGNIQFGTDIRAVYLESYLDIPEVAELRAMSDQFKFNCGKIISYSSKVISLAQSNLPDMEKNEILVDFMESLRPFQQEPIQIEFGMTADEVERVMAEARGREKFMDALTVLQPLTDALSVYLRAMIDEIDAALDRATDVVSKDIDENHKALLDYLATAAIRRNDILLRLQHLTDYRAGAKDAVKELAKGDPEIEKTIGSGADVSYEALKEVETILTDRLQLLDSQHDYLASGIEVYLNERNELNDLAEKTNIALKSAKMAVLIWNRVHRMMAEGITDPAKINVFGIMTSAAGKIL